MQVFNVAFSSIPVTSTNFFPIAKELEKITLARTLHLFVHTVYECVIEAPLHTLALLRKQVFLVELTPIAANVTAPNVLQYLQ